MYKRDYMFGKYKNDKDDLNFYNRLTEKSKELLVKLGKYELDFLSCRDYDKRYEL